ncbi:hypothetical protein BYT27DRAFT_7336478 [Phlegmacium glaucopus]|nr:hypothetical protein BYT27DRAFT_7336478 [Phlegmacium glaucopus]
MTSTPVATITIQVGDIYIIDGRRTIRNNISFNATLTLTTVTPRSASTESASHDPSGEIVHVDTPPSGTLQIPMQLGGLALRSRCPTPVQSRGPVPHSAEIPRRMPAEVSTLTNGHPYYPPTPSHAEAIERTKSSGRMWKRIVDISSIAVDENIAITIGYYNGSPSAPTQVSAYKIFREVVRALA